MKGVNRYGKGWFGESHRHYLAAKGISSQRYFKFIKDSTIPAVENPNSFRSFVEVEKKLVSPRKAIGLLEETGANKNTLSEFAEQVTKDAITGHEKGKAIHSLVIYYKKNDSGEFVPDGFDHPEAAFAANELGLEEIPVVLAKRRPVDEKGNFEFSDVEKQLAEKQRKAMAKAGGLTFKQQGNVIRADVANKQVLTGEEKQLLRDENIHESFIVDTIPDSDKYIKLSGEKYYYE